MANGKNKLAVLLWAIGICRANQGATENQWLDFVGLFSDNTGYQALSGGYFKPDAFLPGVQGLDGMRLPFDQLLWTLQGPSKFKGLARAKQDNKKRPIVSDGNTIVKKVAREKSSIVKTVP